MIILSKEECPQGSEIWKQARMAIPTASSFGEILTPTGKPTTGAKRPNYMNRLLAEWLTGKPTETYCNDTMLRGIELEPEARDSYAFIKDCDTVEVGLVYLDDRKLISCSPDAMVGDNGLWENKCPLAHTHVAYLLKQELPTKYIPQVQGQMWVCDSEWCDFQSHHPDMEPMIKRVYRDESYIRELKKAVDNFVDEMLEKREQLSHMRVAI
jgi:YqaJ-like viral recombinase domain